MANMADNVSWPTPTKEELAREEQQRQEWLLARNKQARADLERFKVDGILLSRLWLQASLDREHWRARAQGDTRYRELALTEEEAKSVCQPMDRIQACVNVFEGARWYWGGLQERVDKCDDRFLEGQGDGWSMRTGCCAGRCLLTLTDIVSGQQITLITADDEKPFARQEWVTEIRHMGPMGVQSIEATELIAMRLVRLATLTELTLTRADDVFFG